MELTNVNTVTVEAGENVPFVSVPVKGGPGIVHRENSGIITLRGLTNQCRARYLVEYSGNIAVPTGGTVGAVSLAIAINGEPLQATLMIATPAALNEFFNVSAQTYIDVPKGCCANISVENTATQAASVANSNMIITRVA